MFGVPIPPSQVERIANFAKIIGKKGGTVRYLVDHIAQLPILERISLLSGYPSYVYIAVSMHHRYIGIAPEHADFKQLFQQVEQFALRDGPISVSFVGFYCDAQHNDEIDDELTGLRFLTTQLETLVQTSPIQGIMLSIGGPPVILKVLNILNTAGQDPDPAVTELMEHFRGSLVKIAEARHQVEAHSLGHPLTSVPENYPHMFLPLTIMTEVLNSYPGRAFRVNGDNELPEHLIGVGRCSLGEAQERSPKYGRLSSWNMPVREIPACWEVDYAERNSSRLRWKGLPAEAHLCPLQVGQRVRIMPSAPESIEGFGWYFVVDSDRIGREDEVVDIYIRWRG